MTKKRTIKDVLLGVEASRRVGWAKFYSAEEGRSFDRFLGMHRLGLMTEVVQRSGDYGGSTGSASKLLTQMADYWMTEPGDRAAFADGRTAANQIVEHRWGNWDHAIRQVKPSGRTEHRGPDAMECRKCNRFLGRVASGSTGSVELKCPNCKTIQSVEL